MSPLRAAALLTFAIASLEAGEQVARTDEELRALAPRLQPGDTLLLAPGEYRPGLLLEGLRGTAERPIVIAGQDRARPPVFAGGSQALHLVRPEHVVLRDLVARGQTGNGINCDDGGRRDAPPAGLVLERVRIERVGPRGNHDGLKLSGIVDFAVRECAFEGWGGSGIDMVGCHRGKIERCSFKGLPDHEQSNGIQMKGGTSRVEVRGCTFDEAGQRALNLGGSTGLEWFRPADADCEARDLLVENCRFRGSDAPIAFVGVDGAVVRRCTFYRPRAWVLRILQESRDARFVPCRRGVFEENVVVFGRLRSLINVGEGTEPASFAFKRNWWFPEQGGPDLRPKALPSPEEGGTWGRDPGLDLETLKLRERSPARGLGAD